MHSSTVPAEAVSPDRLNRTGIQAKLDLLWNYLFPGRQVPPLEYPVMEMQAEMAKRRLVEFIFDQEIPSPPDRQRYGEFTVAPHCRIFIHSGLEFAGPRFKATLSHEMGHYVLHRKLLSNRTYISRSQKVPDEEEAGRYGRMAGISDLQWAEWQANEFMASILLPLTGLIYRTVNLQRELGLRAGQVYIDNQACTQADSGYILANIAVDTMIQFPIVFARMGALGLINDKRFRNPHRGVIDDVQKSLEHFVREYTNARKGSAENLDSQPGV